LPKDSFNFRVVHISSSFAKGGLERFPVRLAKVQERLGANVSVLTHERAYIFEYARRLGVEAFGASSRIGMFTWLWGLREQNIPIILQINANKDLPMAVLAKRLFFDPSLVRLVYRRGTRATKPKKDPYHWCLFREVDLFIAVSRFLYDNILMEYGVPSSRVVCLHNGVDPEWVCGDSQGQKISLREELDIPRNAFVFGQVANIGSGKCPDVFLKGAKSLLFRKPSDIQVFFLLAGEGPKDYIAQLQHLAKSLGISEWVRFLDYQEDLCRLYDAIDCVVLCSSAEPFANVLLEAMSLKKPLIATRSGGTAEIIEDGITGMMFLPFDVDGLAKAMNRLLFEPKLAQRLGEAGFLRYMEHFRMEACARAYLSAYETLFSKVRPCLGV
jgi:glycosyltransferase involved in cell wall biosynthesis